MEKEIEIEGKKIKVREIKYVDFVELDPSNKKEVSKKTIKLATDLTDLEIENLTIKQALQITKVINELNGFTQDFQQL